MRSHSYCRVFKSKNHVQDEHGKITKSRVRALMGTHFCMKYYAHQRIGSAHNQPTFCECGTYIVGQRGSILLSFEGYRYVRNRQSEWKTYWICSKKGSLACRARITTTLSEDENTTPKVILRTGTHNHAVDVKAPKRIVGHSTDEPTATPRGVSKKPSRMDIITVPKKRSPSAVDDERYGTSEAVEQQTQKDGC